MRRTSYLMILMVMSLAAAGCGRGEAAGKESSTAVVRRDSFVVWVSARGRVMAESNITIAPPRRWGLKILKLVAKEGEDVEKGDVLLELDTEELQEWARDVRRDIRSAEGVLDSAEANLRAERDRLSAAVDKANQDVAKAKTVLDELKALPLTTDLRNAEIDRSTGRKAAEQAKVRYESTQRLYAKGGVSLQQLEQRELEHRSAEAEYQRASLVYEVTAAGATQEEVREAAIALELTELNREQAERTLELTTRQLKEAVNKAEGSLKLNREELRRVERVMDGCTIRAPISGTVFYLWIWTHEGREKLKEGMEVRPHHRLMKLPDTTRMQIEVEVEEPEIGTVEVGQTARITLDAYREREFTGKVTRIDHVTERKGGRERGADDSAREDLGTKIVEVLITFDEQDSLIRTGLNGRAEIRTRQEASGLVVPREAVFSVDGGDVVYLLGDGRLVETPVRVGGRSDVDVLIVEGVKEGDRVSLVSPKSGSNRGGTR